LRRKDREVAETTDLCAILEQCKVCRIAMVDEGRPYLVPLNFGYEMVSEKLFLYFHCAKQGRKIEILKGNPQVCFEMDCEHQLIEGDSACTYGYAYASLIGNGKASFIEDGGQKKHALAKILEHQTGKKDLCFDDRMIQNVTLFQIVSNDFTGKRRTR